jgi:hypothetical protein
LFTLATFAGDKPNDGDLGQKIEIITSLLCHPRWPRQVKTQVAVAGFIAKYQVTLWLLLSLSHVAVAGIIALNFTNVNMA